MTKYKASIVLAIGLLAVSEVWAAGVRSPIISPSGSAYGKSYSDWSAGWWQWHFRLPAATHPAYSTTGEDCAAGQFGKVWFLAGAFQNELSPDPSVIKVVREACTVPVAKALFFPILNLDCSTVEEAPFLLTTENKSTCTGNFFGKGTSPIATADALSLTVDGAVIPITEAYHVSAGPFPFTFDVPSDNILGQDCTVKNCTNMTAVSEGYWVMLPPMAAGTHEIHFTGSFFTPDNAKSLIFGLDVTYMLQVTP